MKTYTILSYLAAGVLVSIVMATLYVLMQQNYRTAANDPQLQIAYDIKNRLEAGQSVKDMMPTDSIDLKKSLSTFITLFNEKGKPLQSTGFLSRRMPQLPSGVYEFTKKKGEDVITWQPESDVRIATVLLPVDHPTTSFIAVGRSLREVEKRETSLSKTVLVAWLSCLLVLVLYSLIQFFLNNKTFKK